MRSNPLFLFLLLGACFDDGGSSTVTPAGTVDAEIVWGNQTSGLEDVQKSFGTQVGSEGFWGCQVDQVTILTGTEVLDGFDRDVQGLLDQHLGGWGLSFEPQDAGVDSGSLLLGGLSASYVELDGDCASYVSVEVMAALSRGLDVPVAMVGTLAIAPDGAGLVVSTPGAIDEVEVSWGASTLQDEAWLQVEADLDGSTMMGEVAFTDCAGMACAEREPLATLEGAR